MNEIINKYISKLRSPKVLIIAGIVGIVLIFLSSVIPNSSAQRQAEKNEDFSVENYKAELESDIKEAVKNITGSKNISVVITLESGVRYSYADQREESSANKTESEQQSTQNDLKESYITIKTSDGGEQALLVTAKMPEIRGVAIVCEGGDDEIIAEKIKNAVTAAFGITSKRVYICGRKQ